MEGLVMDNILSYFKDKKVFVTGHTGFKGSWLLACLHEAGARIKGYALAPEHPEGLFNVLHLGNIESMIADIRDLPRLSAEISSFEPDFIFHLAAQPLVRRSYEVPVETFAVNVTGTANVLEAARQLKGKCTIVAITTDKVYENKEQDILYKEEDRLGGYDPYSASKACAEIVISSYRNSFFNVAKYDQHKKGIASVRAGNVIGGGDWSKDRIIPDIVKSLQSKEVIEVRKPDAVRPWQHVLEPLSGYLKTAILLDKNPLKYSKAYNFGPVATDHATVKELVETAIKAWGSGEWKDVSSTDQPHEAGLLKLDISLAQKELGWIPKLISTDAIKWTIDWYKQQKEQRKEYTYNQVKDYFAL